jgi:hypothetical protein
MCRYNGLTESRAGFLRLVYAAGFLYASRVMGPFLTSSISIKQYALLLCCKHRLSCQRSESHNRITMFSMLFMHSPVKCSAVMDSG